MPRGPHRTNDSRSQSPTGLSFATSYEGDSAAYRALFDFRASLPSSDAAIKIILDESRRTFDSAAARCLAITNRARNSNQPLNSVEINELIDSFRLTRRFSINNSDLVHDLVNRYRDDSLPFIIVESKLIRLYIKVIENHCFYILSFGDFIDDEVKIEASGISYSDKMGMLDRFTKEFPGQPVSQLARNLFPQESEVTLASVIASPEQTRPSWSNREPEDTPVSFVKKHFGVWKDGVWDRDGLTKPDLRKTDLQLYNALSTWEKRHPQDRLGLPNQKEEVTRWVDRMTTGEATPASAAERERLRSAQRRRGASVAGE